jgi:hypothetical protein
MSKIIERAVAVRLTQHLETVGKFDTFQSAYRRQHSCETAITRVLDSVFTASDKRKLTVLTLLDLSSAFDTVDHSILCHKLAVVGVSDSALAWLSSYLQHRSQSVIIDSVCSSPLHLHHGVPQGSVLGPLLFTIFLHDIGQVMMQHEVNYVIYADDIQLWLHSNVDDIGNTVQRITECINHLKHWLSAHFLLLNGGKTEVILLGSQQLLSRVSLTELSIDGVTIKISDKVRDLGIILDKSLTFQPYIASVSAASFAYLKVISRIRKSLPMADCLLLVHSLVISRLLYCTTVFNGITKKQLQKLQRIVNAAIRVVDLKSRRDSVNDSLRQHNWLKVEKLVSLRSAALIFSILQSGKPIYLSDRLKQLQRTQHLRSNDNLLLEVPQCSSQMGERAFSRYAPSIWNSIPVDIKKLKKKKAFVEDYKDYLLSE